MRVWNINLSGIIPANLSRSGPNLVHMQVKGWQRSGSLGAIGQVGMGSSDDSGEAGFLCGIPGPTSSTTQQRTFTRFGHDMRIDVTSKIVKGIFENFPLRGHLRGSPKISKLKGSNRYLSLTGLHSSGRTTVMQWLLAAVVQGPNRASGQFFFVWLTVSELRGVKIPQVSHVCLFSHTKCTSATYNSTVTLQNAFGYSML